MARHAGVAEGKTRLHSQVGRAPTRFRVLHPALRPAHPTRDILASSLGMSVFESWHPPIDSGGSGGALCAPDRAARREEGSDATGLPPSSDSAFAWIGHRREESNVCQLIRR
jgi:hypothetical protein